MYQCECSVLPGLEAIAATEIEGLVGERVIRHEGALSVQTPRLDTLLDLQTIIAPFVVCSFPVPRPKALLGHQHLTALLNIIDTVQELWQTNTFRSLRLEAAGAESSVMQRLHETLATAAHLTPTTIKSTHGDLLLRMRRGTRNDWEVLVRLTPFPLATRVWRVCNFPGALNATVANAMSRLTVPNRTDRVLNLVCGSGTLLIERRQLERARHLLGCDTDPKALACARANVQAAGFAQQIQLEAWDATNLPMPSQSVDVICADLPFGQLIGTHRTNETLYPAMLAEATRVAAPGARCVCVSHEVRLLEQAFAAQADAWQIESVQRVHVGGMTPRIVLARLKV